MFSLLTPYSFLHQTQQRNTNSLLDSNGKLFNTEKIESFTFERNTEPRMHAVGGGAQKEPQVQHRKQIIRKQVALYKCTINAVRMAG